MKLDRVEKQAGRRRAMASVTGVVAPSNSCSIVVRIREKVNWRGGYQHHFQTDENPMIDEVVTVQLTIGASPDGEPTIGMPAMAAVFHEAVDGGTAGEAPADVATASRR